MSCSWASGSWVPQCRRGVVGFVEAVVRRPRSRAAIVRCTVHSCGIMNPPMSLVLAVPVPTLESTWMSGSSMTRISIVQIQNGKRNEE